jgi:hypothetical protein
MCGLKDIDRMNDRLEGGWSGCKSKDEVWYARLDRLSVLTTPMLLQSSYMPSRRLHDAEVPVSRPFCPVFPQWHRSIILGQETICGGVLVSIALEIMNLSSLSARGSGNVGPRLSEILAATSEGPRNLHPL